MRWQHQLVVGLSVSASASNYTIPHFEWDSIRPTESLEFHDCYESYQCARLVLPLNWKNLSDPRTVAVALIKLAAKVPDTDATFGGPVFTNPGGPGGSGVDLILAAGRYLQDYIDTPGKKHYEIVSFDPRGVRHSSPQANCFPETVLARDAMVLESRGLGSLSREEAKLAYGLAMMDGFAKKCAAVEANKGRQPLLDHGGEDEILSYMGTPTVARDLVEMVDKFDEWRKKGSSDRGDDERVELKKRNQGAVEDDVPRLQYVGFSYGTVLGNYFASLFPGRVGRMVLDGVCNADDYSNGGGWLTNIVDADAVIEGLFTGCFKAGPTTCALARASDTSASDIRTRLWAWLAQLDATPISGLSSSGNAVVLTGADIRTLLATAAYAPVASYMPLAKLLNAVMQGQDLPLLLSMLESSLLGGPLQNSCPLANDTTPPAAGSDAQIAILCGDGEDITSKNLTWWQSYLDQQTSSSSVFGAFWSRIRFSCSRWRFRANWIYRGPYTTPPPPPPSPPTQPGKPSATEKGRPAAPLLFLTNRLDPVTPLSAARAMARGHPRAGVVVQEAMGHCAIAAAYSRCTKGIVAEYFATGSVPAREVVCEAECGPWDTACRVGTMRAGQPWYLRRFPLGI
ncbi:hypothetical protein E4U54_006566 [Claviceps lovelessii]|nr:hypothetical protein E4U54_006566 [Claviceps lovelessii]